MSRGGISLDNLTGRPGFARELGNQLSGYKTLAIIFEDNCIGLLDSASNRGDYLRDLLGRWVDNFFAIDTNHLLVECDDARFDNCAKGLLLDGIGCINVLCS